MLHTALMKIVGDLKHLEGIKASFGVSESDYVVMAIEEQKVYRFLNLFTAMQE
jgi:hypothetical protein